MARPDRRRYFRINDRVGLSYRAIHSEELDELPKTADNIQITSVDLLRSIDREITAALNALWQNNPATANAIGLLNKKIDILATEMELDYDLQDGIEAKSRQVNLSACGIAFECEDRFDAGQLLALTIVLRPTNTNIKMNGKVIDCEVTEDPDNANFVLRIEFDAINTSVREQLIQHIVRRQSAQLGRLREEDSTE